MNIIEILRRVVKFMNYCILHKTNTSNINIHIKTELVSSNSLNDYQNCKYFNRLCQIGCVNYNKKWSCPPNSPSYVSYSNNYKYCLLLLFSCDLSQFSYVKTEYMKVKTSNSILKSQSDKLTRYLENVSSGKMISNGSCRLCKPCTKKVSAHSCKNPSMLRFSLESLGLNVDKISQDLFDHKLLWYENKLSPKYATVLSGVLTNIKFDSEIFQQSINTYSSESSTTIINSL